MRKVHYKTDAVGLFTGLVEVWSDVENYEGKYQVSSFGRVRSLDRFVTGPRGGLRHVKEKILKQKISSSGYCIVHLRDTNNGKESHLSVHRLVAEAFIPNAKDKKTVNHIDAIKSNNNVRNLEWSTHSEQMVHAVKNNLVEIRGKPKFSIKFKKEILEYYNSNTISISKLALLFGVSSRTAGRIANNGILEKRITRKTSNETFVGCTPLSTRDIDEIKYLRSKGWTLIELAKKFDRGTSHIHRIVNGVFVKKE